MFDNHTVVVVGAGASSECKLPSSFELKKEISKLLDIQLSDGRSLYFRSGEEESS